MKTKGISVFSNRLKAGWENLIQECPLSMSACEDCRKIDCSYNEWIKCEERLRCVEKAAAEAKVAEC